MRESPSEAWARCTPWIAAALGQGGDTHTVDDVALGIEAGRFHFWPAAHCAVVTEFWDMPRLKALNLWLIGGDLREVRALYPSIEDWALANGCRRMCGGGVAGRRAWDRITGRLGFLPRWTVYSKELIA